MKKCIKCAELKEVSEFYDRAVKKSNTCKSCAKDYAKKYNSLLGSKLKRSARRKKERQYVQAYIKNIKNKPCLDCGVLYPPCVMEFDHVRGKKKERLSRMLSATLNTVKAEIEKCELVCANCHRIRTQKRLEQQKTR